MGDLLQPWRLIVLSFLLAPMSLAGLPPFWTIFKKAGFQPIRSVLMPVPLVGPIMLHVVGFSTGKAESQAS